MVRLKVRLLCRGRAPPREFCVASGNVQFDQVYRRSWTALFGAPGWDGTSLSGRETSMGSCVVIVAKKESRSVSKIRGSGGNGRGSWGADLTGMMACRNCYNREWILQTQHFTRRGLKSVRWRGGNIDHLTGTIGFGSCLESRGIRNLGIDDMPYFVILTARYLSEF